ncbi:MAG: GTP-binding protein [Lachnospiraceae bacterium]
MPQKIILLSGASAVGKTTVLKSLIPLLDAAGNELCICKIDCLKTQDDLVYKALKVPCVVGLSEDICPDHFLVSNLPELWGWADTLQRKTLVIETAGLCHRCSPATEGMLAGCVLDATASCRALSQLGPMLTRADFVVLTKIDLISQAEQEIILWKIREENPSAALFPVDAPAGYGADLLAYWLKKQSHRYSYEGDKLRHTMPSGVCSYCVGEQRVGSDYQQGIVGKIDFGEVLPCNP